MMVLTTAAAALILSPQEGKLYRDAKLGLSFEHPVTWEVRKERLYTVFDIPLSTGGKASVQLFSGFFRQPAEDWQRVQVDINAALKREVDQQWDEVILGVPLLLTRIKYEEEGKPMVSLVGLLYSASAEKLNFRLTSPGEGAEEAESAWRGAMLTLRTNSGALPQEETPGKSLEEIKTPPKPVKSVSIASQQQRVVKRGPVEMTFDALGQKVRVVLPTGWTITETEPGKFNVTHAGLAGELVMDIGTGDTEFAILDVRQRVNSAFDEFKVVTLREEPKAEMSDAGVLVAQVFRTGTSASGPLVVGHAVGSSGSLYWLLSYRGESGEIWQKDKPLFKALTALLLVESGE